MYELARIRLHSVGPKGARYQDVTLDLRHVGAVVGKPAQDALFAVESAAGAAVLRRPSPATVVFLENGGGKSVLIKLIFSVMLPGRRQVVGTTSTRVLERFALADDVAHVALEWQHVQTGRQVVIGKVSAWRDHVVSSDPNRLSEAWYSFRPSASFTLDSLPFSENGRLVSMAGFRDRLSNATKAEPEIEAGWQTGHQLWTEKLQALGLDPELFAYQRRMNAGEGEAAEAFAFRSDEAFIDWLLTAVTKEDDPRTLGDVVGNYAMNLAQRDGLTAERAFVAGALERLGPLATAASEASSAQSIRRDVRAEAERFAASVAARHAAEGRAFAALLELADRAEIEYKDADLERRRLNAVSLELERLVAGLRWRAAEEDKRQLAEQRDLAQEQLAAWQATGVILTHAAARDEAEQIRRIVREHERAAAPVLAARDAAAIRLASGLLATAAAADAEAEGLDETATGLEPEIDHAENDREGTTRQAEHERGRAAAADEQVTQAQAAIQEAVLDGLLPSAEDDVPAAANTADTAAEAAATAVGSAMTDLNRHAETRKVIGADLHNARQARNGLAATAAEAHGRYVTAAGTAAALAAEQRLPALLGAEEVNLDGDTPVLLDLLTAALKEACIEQRRLHEEDTQDRRVLDALGDGGLLPPGQDICAALTALEAARITAWSGWQYLARTLPAERDRVLASYPHLVDGVVLNNPDHLPRASEVLADANLLPRSVVAVGSTAALTDLTVPPPPGTGFVVAPNPAMYDEERAAEERQAILGRQHLRGARLEYLARQIEDDGRLRQRLADWRRDFPPGSLEALRREDEQATEAVQRIDGRIAALTERLREIEEAEAEIRRALPGLRAAEEHARAAAGRLASLAAQAANIPEWQSTSLAALAAAAALDEAAGAHRRHADRLRRAAKDAVRRADDQRRIARSCRDELRQVPGAGAVREDHPVPAEALETLRASYETARNAYARVELGADLRADLTRVERAEAEARATVESLKPAARALAATLLATPDAADAAGRAAATDRAQRAHAGLAASVEEQAALVGELKRDYESRQAQVVSLDPYGTPADIPHGEELLARAHHERDQARTRYELASASRSRLDERVANARPVVDGFGAQLDALAKVAPADIGPDVSPFPGDLDDARARRGDVMRQLDEADELVDGAERAVRRTADALAKYATDDAFKDVDSPVRRQIAAVERDELPSYADDWEQALRPRLRSLNDELAQIDRHRSNIVTRLHGLVNQALGTLRSAQRLSRLPADLDDWSGQEFLRIRFADPDRAALTERLGEVIDQAAAAVRDPDKGGGKRDGLSLLLKGVRAAMQPRGVRVEMLKPDAVLRTERVRVAEVGDVFSGGQLLTAAIILYCTMAALRANERGDIRHRHAGVLFLDNPIGRASTGYLLELQMKVARTLGVQLIYTTGLFDTNALSVFPLIVRLRNDADLRAGLKYLSVDQTIRNTLNDLPPAGDSATVTATRVFTRPDEPGSQAS